MKLTLNQLTETHVRGQKHPWDPNSWRWAAQGQVGRACGKHPGEPGGPRLPAGGGALLCFELVTGPDSAA